MGAFMVIFGGTGDLAHRKLYPAIYNLYVSGLLPKEFGIIGVGRRAKTTEEFRREAYESITKYSRSNSGTEQELNQIISRFYYYQVDFYNESQYQKLNGNLLELELAYETGGNRIFYLAVAPEHFGPIVDRIYATGLTGKQENSRHRLVIEKPFGVDLNSATKLNRDITQIFDEEHIYRIDHYLGKEMLQNIMVIRFANILFEPLWNNKYIDHIQITSSEEVGVENRGGYYEGAGAIRDMLQNHMLQLLMLTAMEPPARLDNQSIRDEKVKVLKALAPIQEGDIIRGQYGAGNMGGKEVPSYRGEQRVSPHSNTETYIAAKVMIDNHRWRGVPFYMRTGKRMPCKTTEIAIEFSKPWESTYFKEFHHLKPNMLVIKIQPREGAFLRFNAKEPGTRGNIIPVAMDFCQNCEIDAISSDAYERLLYDVMRGDPTLFTRWDEVEYSWRFTDKIARMLKDREPNFPNYGAGTWGPEEVNRLLEKDGRNWRDVCEYY